MAKFFVRQPPTTGGLRPANCGTPFGRPLLLFRDHVAMHVRAEDFRHDDGAISLLIIFQDSGDGTADSQARAVQGMDEFRFRFRRAAEADIGPACLEIFRIGARRYFTVFPLCREPDFDVEGLGSRETDIAGAQADDVVRQAQGLEDVFGVVGQFIEFVITT